MSEEEAPAGRRGQGRARPRREEAKSVEAKSDEPARRREERRRPKPATSSPWKRRRRRRASLPIDAAAPPPADLDGLDALDAAPSSDEPVPPEATEDHPEELPPDPGSADAASPRLQSIVESLLFAADKPLTLKQLGDLLGETELARVRAAVAAIEVA